MRDYSFSVPLVFWIMGQVSAPLVFGALIKLKVASLQLHLRLGAKGIPRALEEAYEFACTNHWVVLLCHIPSVLDEGIILTCKCMISWVGTAEGVNLHS